MNIVSKVELGNIVGRLQSAFPSHQLDVIIGSLLGDARLECRSNVVPFIPKVMSYKIDNPRIDLFEKSSRASRVAC